MSKLTRDQQMWQLSGEGGPSPYDLEEKRLNDEIVRLQQERMALGILKSHKHNWSEAGFCDLCGWDGNA